MGSLKLMGDIKVNMVNVAANGISSAESFGLMGDDGSERNAAESTKAFYHGTMAVPWHRTGHASPRVRFCR
ncbi:hypothetical protein EAO75_34075 [Streptomyces sp. uw30]|uniref:hypothetical protein n=1 Tax=Streptomyces sp. uw30 TaxID=1828179 RepID=UPI0011CD36C0|nr:hypothetical protein [Streptomyces sp. uw30]TXS41993.1 hypothetical protein EAO75_34075 [Streptomyces sp. uw30]